ncbi:MAG: sulfatase-like hydrolase/transferase [Myxococcota bacterium]
MRYVDAVLCAFVLLAAEWAVVAFGARHEFAGYFELARTALTVLPLAIATALPVAAGGAVMVHALGDTGRRGRWWLAALAVLLGGLTAVGVSGGRLLAATGRRPAFVIAVVVAGGLVAWALQPWLRRALDRLAARGGNAALWPAVFGVSVALQAINVIVLPRLYPAFHLALAVLTVWVAATAARGWDVDAGRRLRLVSAGLVATVALGLSVRAPGALRYADNARFVFVERAPLLRYGLLLAARIVPPPPLDEDGREEEGLSGPSLDLAGRDIVLVSIDALRADHVGAYGYDRPTTPALDALAREGVRFEHAYTATPHTSYAVTSLMTGKYMRPLLRQGVGEDATTWAAALRRYGYQTAAFYPPAVFFIDPEKFRGFAERGLDFEYRKVQFSAAADRAREVEDYLEGAAPERPLFLWVHLFEPHEPYEAHAEHPFGARSIDRYDSEIAAADAGLDAIVRVVRARRPGAVVIVTADHGEEFGDHGGRYHGTTVYEEQVRVPLVVHAPDLLAPRRIEVPVSLVDLYPTVLSGVGMPQSPRVRGRDRGSLIRDGAAPGERGLAFAETDGHTMLASGPFRLVCDRRVDACRLYDVIADPAQSRDVAAAHAETFASMKRRSAELVASMGTYEGTTEGDWPRALRRGIAGDGAAALDVAGLLDDVDVRIRRKAAEVLFALREPQTASHLRRALEREEDDETRRWAAVALTRLGQGAGLAYDLLEADAIAWRRRAALALAESGDARGAKTLIGWWRAAYPDEKDGDAPEPIPIPFDRARDVVAALGNIRSEDAVVPLTWGLRDVRLRVHIAEALATIGEEAARPALAAALESERYHHARSALARALVKLGGRYELRDPLVRFLGVPDPIPDGLALAIQADLLAFVGGPRDAERRRLREFATSGVVVGVRIPESPHASGEGIRVVVRVRAQGRPGEVRIGRAQAPLGDGRRRRRVPKHTVPPREEATVSLAVPVGTEWRELVATLPPGAALEPGDYVDLVVYATQSVEMSAFAAVPLAHDVPPPAPEPWTAEP